MRFENTSQGVNTNFCAHINKLLSKLGVFVDRSPVLLGKLLEVFFEDDQLFLHLMIRNSLTVSL